MADTKVTTYTANRQTFDIYVDGKNGNFFAHVNPNAYREGDRVTDKTLTGLQAKLRKHAKQRTISIPVTLVSEPSWRSSSEELEIEHGFVTGIHAGNDRILYRNEDGESDTIGGSYDGQVCRRLTPEELETTTRIWAERCAAKKAWEVHYDSLKANARTLIDEELKKVPEPQEGPYTDE